MPSASKWHPALPIAVLPIGPSAPPLLAQLRQNTPAAVHLLTSEVGLCQLALTKMGLLILLVHQQSAEDTQAVLALAQQVQETGFGAHTLCVALPPPQGADEAQLQGAEEALQALQTHLDALLRLPSDVQDTTDVAHWLALVVGDMAHSLDEDAMVGMDMEDIAALVRNAGAAVWLSVQASGPDKTGEALRQLRAHPWVAGLPLNAVQGMGIWISAAPQELKMREVAEIVKDVQQYTSTDASIVLATHHHPSLSNTLRLSVLLTGPLYGTGKG